MDGKFNALSEGTRPLMTAKVINCGNCSAPLQLRAEGMSQVVVCSACGSISDTTSEAHHILVGPTKAKRQRRQVIELGTRGKIHGSLWEVIGYMERYDGGIYVWSEYLLFNPMKGFRWLSENAGHWSYVLMVKERPVAYTDSAQYAGHFYKIFHKGEATITYILGEFYWQAKYGDKTVVTDYVRDHEILSREESASEKIWSVGEYVDADTVKKAFKIKEMPTQTGVAPNQPCPISEKLKDITKLWGTFLTVLVAIQFLFMLISQSKTVYTSQNLWTSQTTRQVSTEPFVVNGGVSNLEIELQAPLDNNWLYVQGELVNVDTGEQVEFDQGIEFYSGFDGEYWTEGSRTSQKNIPSIEKGTYQLNLEASTGAGTQNFTVIVRRNVLLWKPFLWALVLLSLWPLFLLWRRRSFALKKWAESDYSPYHQHSDENYV